MKNEKTKPGVKGKIDIIAEQVTEKDATLKKEKKNKQIDESPTAEQKVKKTKSEKSDKKPVEPKDQKAPKEDKLIKFLVSMTKPLRKSIKKEAAEVGVSMNEFIVLAVEEKLRQG